VFGGFCLTVQWRVTTPGDSKRASFKARCDASITQRELSTGFKQVQKLADLTWPTRSGLTQNRGKTCKRTRSRKFSYSTKLSVDEKRTKMIRRIAPFLGLLKLLGRFQIQHVETLPATLDTVCGFLAVPKIFSSSCILSHDQ
jgi:hypothetical protein